jgi:VWFA-related protein
MTERRPTSRLGPALAGAALLCSLAVRPAAEQQPTFRSAVELVAVDVQVVNADGDPVDRLGPDSFEVSIKGQRRKVVSADFVRHQLSARVSSTAAPATSSEAADGPAPSTVGRTVILAFDAGSFEVGTEDPPIDAVRGFLQQLGPNDRVGLWIFPRGVWIPPTTERAPLRVALSNVIGMRQPLHSTYHLRPGEIVDITTESANPNSFLSLSRGQAPTPFIADSDPVLRVQQRECPGEVDCPIRIYQEGMGLAAQIEHEVQESLGGIELLMRRLTALPGRKSVVLVSGGLLVSDRLEGRPDVGKMAELIGQAAARANASVYTIHYDTVMAGSSGAGARRGGAAPSTRDRALFGHWLDQFSDGAGGRRMYVPTGQGDFAFGRVLRELSAHYLLGVEPADEDRDGQPRKLQVKVGRRGLTVRSRQWVVVPARRV